jgi:hypothetical protein
MGHRPFFEASCITGRREASITVVPGAQFSSAALFVVPLLALLDVRLIPGPMLLASVALPVMMAYRGRAAINRRELTLSLIGLCVGTAVGAWGLSLVAPASLACGDLCALRLTQV